MREQSEDVYCECTGMRLDKVPAAQVEACSSSSGTGATQISTTWAQLPELLHGVLDKLPALQTLSLQEVPSTANAVYSVAKAARQLPPGARLELAFADSHAGELSHGVLQALAALPALCSLRCSVDQEASLEPLCTGAADQLSKLSLALNGPAFDPHRRPQHASLQLARCIGRLPTCLTDLHLEWHPQLNQLMQHALDQAASAPPDSALQAFWNADFRYVQCLESKHLEQLSNLLCLQKLSLAYDASHDRRRQQQQEEQQEQAQLRLEQQQKEQRQHLCQLQQQDQQHVQQPYQSTMIPAHKMCSSASGHGVVRKHTRSPRRSCGSGRCLSSRSRRGSGKGSAVLLHASGTRGAGRRWSPYSWLLCLR